LIWVTLLFVLSSCTLRAQSWKWTVESLDAPKAEQTSIAADKDDNLHLVYYLPEALGELRYAFRSAADSRWYKMTLDDHLGVFSTGIALDSHGNPGVCYTPRMMKYAHWNGKKWTIQEVDPGSGLIAYHCSVKYAPDDWPEMTWYLESAFVLRYAALEDGAWKASSVEAGTESGKWNSLILGSGNSPQVAYSSFKGGQLKYAHFDGRNWVNTVIDSPAPGDGPRGMGASLVLDAKGLPCISYYDLHSLKYARFDGTHWVKEIVEELPMFENWSWKNFQSAQLLDSNGNPHISYESHLGLKHAWRDGKGWHTQLLIPSADSPFFESSMTIDRHDNLYISFKNPSDHLLNVAIGRFIPAE